jgi:hypothetical protein
MLDKNTTLEEAIWRWLCSKEDGGCDGGGEIEIIFHSHARNISRNEDNRIYTQRRENI